MNDVYEMAKVLAGDSSRKRVVDASDYGTMPNVEFVEAVFSTNDRDSSREVLTEVIDRLAAEAKHYEAVAQKSVNAREALDTIGELIDTAQRHNRDIPWSRIQDVIRSVEKEEAE